MNKTAVLNMSGTLSCFICVILGFYSTSGQLWEKETLRNETFCDFKNLNLSCSSDEMIALHSLQYAYNVRCETTCCNTYTSTDCFVNATSSDIQGLRRMCSGQPTCTLPSPPSKQDFCSLGTKTASYMFLQYYCIQKTRVSSVPSGPKLTSDAEPLYLTNANYPSVTTGSDSSSCSLEVHSCTSGINLYILDADLYLDTDTCEQNIAFLDGTNQTLYTIDCENYYSYKVESRQVNSHYMKINFINNSTSNQEGLFFIGLDATSSGASFSLSCTFEQESWCTGCGNVSVISDGQIDHVDVNNSSYGALANVICDSGYETNTPTISCLANNSWADAACTEKAACTSDEWRCSNGDCIPSNARCDNLPGDCTDQSDEDNCNAVICPEGLESCPHGNGSDVCVPKTAGCSCGAVPTLSNGAINSVITTIGSSAVVDCDDGYEASKPNVICQTTGLWETATCNVKDCGTIPHINFGEFKLSVAGSTTYGSSASVVCATGYLPDKQTITCTPSGIWESAVCTIIDCGPIPNVAHGSVHLNPSNITTYAATAYVTCDSGYKPKQETIMCQATGNWDTPVCDESKPVGKPTEDKKSLIDVKLIIILVVLVVLLLVQFAVMFSLQRKLHDIQMKAKGEDYDIHKRIFQTVLGSIPILGLIPIYLTWRVFYKKVYKLKHTHESTENNKDDKAYVNLTLTEKGSEKTEIIPDKGHPNENKTTESKQMTNEDETEKGKGPTSGNSTDKKKENSSENATDQGKEPSIRNSDSTTDQDRSLPGSHESSRSTMTRGISAVTFPDEKDDMSFGRRQPKSYSGTLHTIPQHSTKDHSGHHNHVVHHNHDVHSNHDEHHHHHHDGNHHHLSEDVEMKRQELKPIADKARAAGKHVEWKLDQLYINNCLYHPDDHHIPTHY